MRHGRAPTIPEHRRAPSGLFRHSVPDTEREFSWTWTDYPREALDRLFEQHPDANVYDENGRRVGQDGEPIGFAG